MKIPYAKQLPFIICDLSFLQPAMTTIQYQNFTTGHFLALFRYYFNYGA